MLTKEQIYNAHNRNLLVFDGDSDGTVLTERLMKVMAEVAGYNQIVLDTIYVPEVECEMVEGWPIIVDPRLNIGGEFYTYLVDELKNFCAYNILKKPLKHYVIATGPTDVLLGNC